MHIYINKHFGHPIHHYFLFGLSLPPLTHSFYPTLVLPLDLSIQFLHPPFSFLLPLPILPSLPLFFILSFYPSIYPLSRHSTCNFLHHIAYLEAIDASISTDTKEFAQLSLYWDSIPVGIHSSSPNPRSFQEQSA